MFRLHTFFQIDTQSVSDAVDVIKIGDDLGGVGNASIVEAVLLQGVHIGLANLAGCFRQLDGEIAKGAINLG